MRGLVLTQVFSLKKGWRCLEEVQNDVLTANPVSSKLVVVQDESGHVIRCHQLLAAGALAAAEEPLQPAHDGARCSLLASPPLLCRIGPPDVTC